jgi:phosphopentomutase
VPLIVLHKSRRDVLGTRASFADIAASLAEFFGVGPWRTGASFLA